MKIPLTVEKNEQKFLAIKYIPKTKKHEAQILTVYDIEYFETPKIRQLTRWTNISDYDKVEWEEIDTKYIYGKIYDGARFFMDEENRKWLEKSLKKEKIVVAKLKKVDIIADRRENVS